MRDFRLETGFTLVELALSMVIMAIVLALFVPTLVVLLNGQENVAALTDANTKIQPALEALRNQVNSASVLYDPLNNTGSYSKATVPAQFALLLYTVTNTGTPVCSQWRVHSAKMQYREWTPTHPTPTPFRTETPGVTVANTETPKTLTTPHAVTTEQPVFQLVGHSAPQDEEILLTLWLSPSKKAHKIEYSTVDAVQGVPTTDTSICAVPPAQ